MIAAWLRELEDAEEFAFLAAGDQGEREMELVVVAELADEFVLGLAAVLLSPDFVVGLCGDLGEVVVTLGVAQVASNVEALGIFEVHDSTGNGRLRTIDDDAVDGVPDSRHGLGLEGKRDEAAGAEEKSRQRRKRSAPTW